MKLPDDFFTLIKNGFEMSIFDTCVCFKKDGDNICIVLVWVDDLLIAHNYGTIYESLLNDLKRYKHKTIIEPILFLGVTIERNRKERTMSVSQPEYFSAVLKKFGMDDCNPIATPMENGKAYHKTTTLSQKEADYIRAVPEPRVYADVPIEHHPPRLSICEQYSIQIPSEPG